MAQKLALRTIKFSLILLVLFLPINDLLIKILVTFGFSQYLTLWKEICILSIILACLFLINYKNLLQVKNLRYWFLLILIIFLAVLSSVINFEFQRFVLGFRVEIFWVILLVLLNWQRNYLRSISSFEEVSKLVFFGYLPIMFVSILSLIFGIENFYNFLGLGGGWGVEKDVFLQAPICHRVTENSQTCRLSTGFASPVNFAGYLILVTPFLFFFRPKQRFFQIPNLGALLSLPIFAYLSYSRFVLVILICWTLFLAVFWLQRRKELLKSSRFGNFYNKFCNNYIFRPILILTCFLPILLNFLFIQIAAATESKWFQILPAYLSRSASSLGHYKMTSIALEAAVKNRNRLFLTGYGLGQTGSIAKPQYGERLNSPFVQENLELAEKYKVAYWEMSVPENWYLQVLLNGGLIYFLLYFALIGQSLFRFLTKIWHLRKVSVRSQLLFLSLFGICAGNLFLHLWENPVITNYFAFSSLLLNLELDNLSNKNTNHQIEKNN